MGGAGGDGGAAIARAAPGTVRDDADGLPAGLQSELNRALAFANDLVRSNPWQVLGAVAVVSLAAGYGLAAAYGSRR